MLSSNRLHRWREREGGTREIKWSVVENVWTASRSTRGPRGYKEQERERGLRKEGKASRGYGLCYGVTMPRECEDADRMEDGMKGMWAKALVSGHKVRKG